MTRGSIRRTARAIILRDDELLVFERWRRGSNGYVMHFYSIPGGGIEKGETPEEAVVRELKEEMGVDIKVERLLMRQHAPMRYHYYFLCTIVAGEPKFQTDSIEAQDSSDTNRYKATWINIRKYPHQDTQPYPAYAQALERLVAANAFDKIVAPIDTVSETR